MDEVIDLTLDDHDDDIENNSAAPPATKSSENDTEVKTNDKEVSERSRPNFNEGGDSDAVKFLSNDSEDYDTATRESERNANKISEEFESSAAKHSEDDEEDTDGETSFDILFGPPESDSETNVEEMSANGSSEESVSSATKSSKDVEDADQLERDLVRAGASQTFRLHPHQVDGVKYCASLRENKPGIVLADEQGLGKTHQALAGVILRLHKQRFIRSHQPLIAVVCPSSAVADQWKTVIDVSFTDCFDDVFVLNRTNQRTFSLATSSYSAKPRVVIFCESQLQAATSRWCQNKPAHSLAQLWPHIDRETKRKICKARYAWDRFNDDSHGKLHDQVMEAVNGMRPSRVVVDALIIDEAHKYRNFCTFHSIGALLLRRHAKRAILLSGTPFDRMDTRLAMFALIDPRFRWCMRSVWAKRKSKMMPAEVRTFLADHCLRRINIRLPKLTKYTVRIQLSGAEQSIHEICRIHKCKARRRMESLKRFRHRAAEFRRAKENFMAAHQACEATTLHPMIFRGRRACSTFASPRIAQSNCDNEKCAICGHGDASKMKRRKNEMSDFIVDDSDSDSDVDAAIIPEGPLVKLPDDLCCSHALFGFRHVGHETCIETMKERISGAPAATWQDFQKRVAGMGFSTEEKSKMWHSGETSYGDIVQATRKKNGESDDGAFSVGVPCPCCRRTIHRMRHHTDPGAGWILEHPNPGHVCKLRCSSKMIAILDVFRRRIRNEKFLMFSESIGFLDLMEGLFRHHGVRTGRYDGDNADSRADVLDEFKRGGTMQGLLISTRCGATGLNLQVARHVIFPERPPRGSTLNQAIKRVHRIGQTRECYAYIFEAVYTTDFCRVERHAEHARKDIEYYRAANEISLSTPDVCEKDFWEDECGDDDGDDDDGNIDTPGNQEEEEDEEATSSENEDEEATASEDEDEECDFREEDEPSSPVNSWIHQWSTSARTATYLSQIPTYERKTTTTISDSKRKAPPPSVESTRSARKRAPKKPRRGG